MLLTSWLGFQLGVSRRTPRGWHPAHRRATSRRELRPTVERLEVLTLLTNYTAATVSDLIADINASNQQGGTNTIALVAGNSFLLTAVDNTTDGATGLPVIAVHDNLTIVGNGDAIARSTVTGTPAFRLLDVAAGASLTLQNLTLQGGLAFGSGVGVSAEGGAVYNQGTLDLNGVTVQDNEALGAPGVNRRYGNGGKGGNGSGGGLYVAGGSLTLTGSTLSADTAQGGQGGQGGHSDTFANGDGGDGGNGSGGGLYVAGGSVTLTGVTLSADTAQGGQGGRRGAHLGHGGNGGGGSGAGLYAGGGTVALSHDTVTGNAAQGGAGGGNSGGPGLGEGGGLFIDPAAIVSLDAFTQANVTGNTASTKDPNIHGPWKRS